MENLEDRAARQQAITTFDRNVVVEAGAGTGKTTLLIDRLLHLLLRSPDPLDINDLVALTFTNKAANELRVRLRERLQLIMNHPPDRGICHQGDAHQRIRDLQDYYHIEWDQLNARARAALFNLEKAQIGTIHSFAAHLLRLFPIEAGIDPGFKEDEGEQFKEFFRKEWSLWLEQELSGQSQRRSLWKELLRHYSLEDLEHLAFQLGESWYIPGSILGDLRGITIHPSIRQWLEGLAKRAELLFHKYERETLLLKMLKSAFRVINSLQKYGLESIRDLKEEGEILKRSIPGPTQGWKREDYLEAKEIIQVARHSFQIEEGRLSKCLELVLPFVEGLQKKFLQAGFISFNGLLLLTRNLLRENLRVRQILKERYKAILVDEFQDTDPLQYEIILYLAEAPDQQSPDWRSIRLAPGKLFIVGDPKQSIYSFRRADIEAYNWIVHHIIRQQGGLVINLTTNFRSHTGILRPINWIFQQLIKPKPFLQPPYVHLVAHQDRPPQLPTQRVELRLIEANHQGVTAAEAIRIEAEALARWLREEVLGREIIIDEQGRECRTRPSHIALLFRKLTSIPEYLEALRRYDIPFIVEGERHFYAIQEVLDFINLLRVIENPYDTIALVGLLRSPLGGLTDKEIYQLQCLHLLDYRQYGSISDRLGLPKAKQIRELYRELCGLHQATLELPICQAIELIFERLPVLELAAASFHQEQAIANLKKIHFMAQQISPQLNVSLKGFIHLLERRRELEEEETENPLIEEGIDALRIMSIHRAKGLEFPMVILAGLQSRTRGSIPSTWLEQDWSSGVTGLRLREDWSLGGLFIFRRSLQRQEEEEKRLLYVAMTRARERLVLSGVLTNSRTNPLQELLSLMEGYPVESQELEIRRISPLPPRPERRVAAITQQITGERDWAHYTQVWRQREQRYRDLRGQSLTLSPTSILTMSQDSFQERHGGRGGQGQLIGILAHRILENWDFSCPQPSWLLSSLIGPMVEKLAPKLTPETHRSLCQELYLLFHTFFSSDIYLELRQARVLGRELPFTLSWNGRIMEGVIDVIYQWEGRTVVADYKTERLGAGGLDQWMRHYHTQAEIYTEAARRTLHTDHLIFKFILLSLGKAITVSL